MFLCTATDYVKGSLDNLASGAQPQSEKSTTQKIGDAVSGGESPLVLKLCLTISI